MMIEPDNQNGAAAKRRFLAAFAGLRREGPPPVWLMRQAGRTLASYRALRGDRPFLQFCKDIEAATTATLLPVRELGVDAAILFADILLPVEAWGIALRYEEGVGPVLDPPIRSRADLDRLRERQPVEVCCAYVGEIVTRVKAELPPDLPLIGFAPAPWTLAAYLVQGRGVKGFPALKRFAYNDPEGFATLLERLVELLTRYARLQLEAGVDAFQLFDTWAELAPPTFFRERLRPSLVRLLEDLEGIPRIYFGKGTATHLEHLAGLPIEGLACDMSVDLVDVRWRLGPELTLQGNFDPSLLYARPEVIRAAVWRELDRLAGDARYVVNLGHGLPPDVPEAHVRAFVEAVRSWPPPEGTP